MISTAQYHEALGQANEARQGSFFLSAMALDSHSGHMPFTFPEEDTGIQGRVVGLYHHKTHSPGSKECGYTLR